MKLMALIFIFVEDKIKISLDLVSWFYQLPIRPPFKIEGIKKAPSRNKSGRGLKGIN